MGHQEKPGAPRSFAENPIHRAVCERDPLLGAGHRVGVGGGAAIAGPVERDHGVSVLRAGSQQRRLRMAGAIEIQCGGASAVNSDDHRSRVRRLGDQRGHRHAVDDDEPGLHHGLRRRRGSPIGPQQQHPARRQSAAADHADAGVGDLPFAGLAAQLGDRFVQQTHAVGSAV